MLHGLVPSRQQQCCSVVCQTALTSRLLLESSSSTAIFDLLLSHRHLGRGRSCTCASLHKSFLLMLSIHSGLVCHASTACSCGTGRLLLPSTSVLHVYVSSICNHSISSSCDDPLGGWKLILLWASAFASGHNNDALPMYCCHAVCRSALCTCCRRQGPKLACCAGLVSKGSKYGARHLRILLQAINRCSMKSTLRGSVDTRTQVLNARPQPVSLLGRT